jgi:hypothetical protein
LWCVTAAALTHASTPTRDPITVTMLHSLVRIERDGRRVCRLALSDPVQGCLVDDCARKWKVETYMPPGVGANAVANQWRFEVRRLLSNLFVVWWCRVERQDGVLCGYVRHPWCSNAPKRRSRLTRDLLCYDALRDCGKKPLLRLLDSSIGFNIPPWRQLKDFSEFWHDPAFTGIRLAKPKCGSADEICVEESLYRDMLNGMDYYSIMAAVTSLTA